MSDTSAVLSLPYIQPAQAQKHVTHNAAVQRLDRIVQLSVLARDQATPPASPDIGARYIVAGSGSGDWAGQGGAIAVFDTGNWHFEAPGAGWLAYDEGEGTLVVYTQAEGWQPITHADLEVDALGVGTSADPINRLAVAAEATLLTHTGAGHQLKVNKSAAGDTASLLFQTGFSGRAEMGTAGSDDFEIKVSADGSTWAPALTLEAGTGVAQFPSGAKVPAQTPLIGRWQCDTTNEWAGFSLQLGENGGNHVQGAGTGADPVETWHQMGLFVAGGTRMNRLKGLIRSSSSEVTGVDIRIYHQYGLADGTLSGPADVTRDVVWSVNNAPLSGIGFLPVVADLAGYIAPRDGNLLVFVRPVGTLSAVRYVYLSCAIETVSPG